MIKLFEGPDGRRVEVVSQDGGITVYHAQGGGFQLTTMTDYFNRNFKPVTGPAPYRRALISADWMRDEEYDPTPAWVNGDKWNGWEMPMFELEVAKALVEMMPDLHYVQGADVFADIAKGDDVEVFRPVWIPVGDAWVKAYPIGAGSWCWYEEGPPLSSKTECNFHM